MTDPTPTDPSAGTALSSAQKLTRWIHTGGWRALAGAAVGASLLAAYSYLVGCRTGTCLLTSNVQTATLFGGLVGLVTAWPAPTKREAVRVKR